MDNTDDNEDLYSLSRTSTRDTIFDNLVNNENDFTELLCNMTKFKKFETILADFLGIKGNIISIEPQFKTEENGRPDLVIEHEDGILFIEVKVNNTGLTKNQPVGYIKELEKYKEITSRKLYFLIPKNYSHLPEIKNSIKNVKNSKVEIEPIFWEDFFNHCKQDKNITIFQGNKVLFEYYKLLKSLFGYETFVFMKEEQNSMKENVKEMENAGVLLEIIYNSLINKNGFKLKTTHDFHQIGMDIYDKNKNVCYGWFGIFFPLTEKNDDIYVFIINDKEKKIYDNFIEKYKNKYKTFIHPDDKKKETEHKYICFDDDIFGKNDAESIICTKLLEIIKDIKSTK